MSQNDTRINPPTNHVYNQRLNPKKSLIVWQDLRQLSRVQVLKNILFPTPFLVLFWLCLAQNWWFAAFAMAFFSFSACLRLAHDCYHRSLGVSKIVSESLLFILSGVLFCSTHAIRHTHLRHHREALSDSDIEGAWARLPWYVALFAGIVFTIKIQWAGLTQSHPAQQRLVIIDLLIITTLLSVAMITMHPILLAHIAIMSLGNMLVGFFGVWLLHHDIEPDIEAEVPARSERNWFINLLTFGQFYHREHHLYPAVPTDNLHKLAQRLDSLSLVKPIAVVPFLPQADLSKHSLSKPCLSSSKIQRIQKVQPPFKLSMIKVRS
ncbi:fatty acid desaturase family protein [Psychrobacter sp. I-STPA10]|uniref:fatty acid desaturase family protein n=1 Tax=Psychrobacter sp. I-STPA10 TaxID=2585769 RepID=UPI001E585579|nr:fatty acid desaturase [Psychrobacter sp. I-STPA10]